MLLLLVPLFVFAFSDVGFYDAFQNSSLVDMAMIDTSRRLVVIPFHLASILEGVLSNEDAIVLPSWVILGNNAMKGARGLAWHGRSGQQLVS